MDKNEVAHYNLPKTCPRCGSEKIVARVLYDRKILRYLCLDCGYSDSVAKEENLQKRVNSSLNSWRWRVIKHQPWCAVCGSKEDLEAHHIIPVSHVTKSRELILTDTNGITLCKRCHHLVHNREEYEEGE